jgi:hypothetical protein
MINGGGLMLDSLYSMLDAGGVDADLGLRVILGKKGIYCCGV